MNEIADLLVEHIKYVSINEWEHYMLILYKKKHKIQITVTVNRTIVGLYVEAKDQYGIGFYQKQELYRMKTQKHLYQEIKCAYDTNTVDAIYALVSVDGWSPVKPVYDERPAIIPNKPWWSIFR